MEGAVEVEFKELCRLCANPRRQDIMIPIFARAGLKMRLLEKIHRYIPISIVKDDGFPDHVCIQCTSKLVIVDQLVETCCDAEARLQALKTQLDLELQELKSPVPKRGYTAKSGNTSYEKEGRQPITINISDNSTNPISKKSIISEDIPVSCSTEPQPSSSTSPVAVILSEKHDETADDEPKLNIVLVNMPKEESPKEELATHSDDSNLSMFNSNTGDGDIRKMVVDAELLQMQAAEKFLRTLEESLDMPAPVQKEDIGRKEKLGSKSISKLPLQKSQNENTRDKVKQKVLKCKTSILNPIRSDIRRSQRVRVKNKFYDSDDEMSTGFSESYECKMCKKIFSSISGLKIHNNKSSHKMQLEKMVCLSCNTKFKDSNSMKDHPCYVGNKFSCEFCDQEFPSIQEVDLHKLEHSIGPFICAICNTNFNLLSVLQDHIIEHNRDKRLHQCNYCGKTFKSKVGLKGHQVRHTNARTYHCYICQIPFSNKEEMMLHRNTHSKEDKEVAVQSKRTKIASLMKRHPCEICGKFLSSKEGLIIHLRMHKGEKPYECDHCGRRFRQSIKLRYHQRLHDGDLPYGCDICEKRFNTQRQMDTHTRVHTNERPFICEICGMRFRSNGVLGRHKNTHSEEPLFSCSFCGKRFRTRHATTVHERTHTGERRFMCDICGRSFAQKNTLDKHRLRHEKQRVECLECHTTFASRKGLRRHYERKHTPVIVESIQVIDSTEFVTVPIDDLVVEVV